MTFTAPSRVEDLLNFRLNRLLASSGAMVTRLCEGRYGITRREWRMICILAAQGPLSPSELAEHAHLERARVSRHVTDLVSKNLIERLAVDTDKRRARLQLNQRGRDVFDELFPLSVAFNNQVLAALTPAQVAELDKTLDLLMEAADAISRSHPIPDKADRRHGGSRRQARATPPPPPAWW
ncbi:MarR family transcriptional regulator [Comamonadaceae bacterium G21597-S1]|nr:MarR family transcriptional regulator [Comamonadaceae bacterium G21597-S1]